MQTKRSLAVTLQDLCPDPHNPNAGTARGRGMVEQSLRETGAGRSIVVDKHGTVIAGNKTLEAWAEVNGAVEVVHTDGNTLVVVQRDDLDLGDTTGPARKLAYFDNRTGEIGLAWQMEQLAADLGAGLDLSGLWSTAELEKLLTALPPLSTDGLPDRDVGSPDVYEASHVRMVQLFLDTSTLPEFERYIHLLREEWEQENTTDTVMEALRRACAALTSQSNG